MKCLKTLPVIIHKLYIDYCHADKDFNDAKKRKEQKKAQILAWLKKEQTDGYIVDKIKVIAAIRKSGAITVDKIKLEKQYPLVFQDVMKKGNDSVSLSVARLDRLLNASPLKVNMEDSTDDKEII
jgi:hypothetical protein